MKTSNLISPKYFVFDLRKLFLISFILGILSIVVFTLLPLGNFARWTTVLIPAVIIAVYAAIGSRNVGKGHEQTSEQLADSCYFLGFLFTLSSLIVALVFLSTSSSASGRIDVFSVLMSFALALITTIVGLVCKILLTQFSTTLNQERRRAMGDLTEATTQFTVKLANSTGKVDRFLASAEAHIIATTEKSVEDLTTISKQHTGELLNTLSELNTRQDETTKKTTEKTEELFTSINQGLQAFARSTESLSSTLEDPRKEIVSSLENFTKALVATEKKLNEFQNRISTDSEKYDFDANYGKKVSELFDYVENSSHTSKNNIESLSNTSSQLQEGALKLSDRMEDMSKALGNSLDSVEKMSSIMPNKLLTKEYADSLERSFADQKYSIDLLANQVEQLAKTVEKADKLINEEFKSQTVRRGFFGR